MPVDPIVDFAQHRFGANLDWAELPPERPRVPDWLVPELQDDMLEVQGDDTIVAEEGAAEGHGLAPVADGMVPEILAFYLPFHFCPEAWGVYVLTSGVWRLARRLALPTDLPEQRELNYAYRLLLEHERFHFCAEYAASRAEVMAAESRYRSYFDNAEAALHEEALANAQALRALRRLRTPDLDAAARVWMTTQPPGYCDFAEWLPPRVTAGKRRAAAFVSPDKAVANRMLGALPEVGTPYAWHPAEFLFPARSERYIPIRVVFDPSVPWLQVAKPFPKEFGLQVFVYPNDHSPRHVHIECPPGKPRTRYRWPELVPVKGDPSLRASERKRLDQYVSSHGAAIAEKVKAVPWK